ncbi:dienelactone hydrolase family protein [Treponema parvum]|uniref:Dienelactone hydrolase family protein n=1 Tax=Treponema parvum TaxID=138851 RepID=A0A975EZK0_9SPIR|nr:CocE/NonD family hydrolase [Treponema parvum]QTQ11840.1 dienelactone hydrolase family protein [Treponema parvum]
MKKAKTWLVIALAMCFISVIVTSAIQTSMGKVKVSELRLVDSAGYEVSVQLYKPNTATPKNPAPCIITIEGWYNNKEMQDLYSVEFARRGYVVIAADMHGHGDSEATTDEGLFTAGVGTDAAVELAATLPYVDRSRIGMTGHSSGASAGINMEIQVDNEKEKPLVKAALLQASLWVDDAGHDCINEYGDKRSVGIIQSKYDEFYYYADDKGNAIYPAEFLKTGGAKNFVNFGHGPLATAEVESGKMYELTTDGETNYRSIYQNNTTHPRVHFSTTAVAFAIKFFEKVFPAPNPIPANNQVWQAKAAFNLLGLIGIGLFVVAFINFMVETNYFAVLKADEEAKPKTIEKKALIWYWAPLCIGALFSALSYKWSIDHIYSKTTSFFNQTGPLTIGIWSALSGVFCIVMLSVWYFFVGKKSGFCAKDEGIKMPRAKIWKTVQLSLLTVTLAFLILFAADYFCKTDFRFWVLTFKAFDADKVNIGLRFLPFFLFFYVVNSISCNCFNFNQVGGRFNTAIFGLFNAGGAIVYVLIQYLTYFVTGLPKWYANEGEMISGIWLYGPIFFLFITPFISRAVYKKTKNPYLAAIVIAIIITMMSVANTTTMLGGGAYVAASY